MPRWKRAPWRCRHGWHRWGFVHQADDRHTIEVPGHPPFTTATIVDRCDLCGLRRAGRREIPRRPKVRQVPTWTPTT